MQGGPEAARSQAAVVLVLLEGTGILQPRLRYLVLLDRFCGRGGLR